jgi:hypothetical protein
MKKILKSFIISIFLSIIIVSGNSFASVSKENILKLKTLVIKISSPTNKYKSTSRNFMAKACM